MKYYTMQEAIKKSGTSKNTIIRMDASKRIKLRRDPVFNYRLFTLEDIKQIKKSKRVYNQKESK